MNKALVAVLIFAIVFVIGIVIIGRTFYPDNIAQTSPDGGKKGLKTLFVESDVSSTKKASVRAVEKLKTWGGAWRLVDETDGGSIRSLKVEIPVVVFTDDLEITIKKEANKTRVDVRSQSRVGKSDFGENARHVRQFLEVLDIELSKIGS